MLPVELPAILSLPGVSAEWQVVEISRPTKSSSARNPTSLSLLVGRAEAPSQNLRRP